jgi:hypothetical protein
MLALCKGGLVLRNGLDLKQRHLRVFGIAFFRCRLANRFHHLGKRASELESLSATLQLLAKGLPIGVTEVERLAAFRNLVNTSVTSVDTSADCASGRGMLASTDTLEEPPIVCTPMRGGWW